MKGLFFQLFDMSVSASWLVLAVVLVRLALRKAPKYFHCVLWAMVALRLICPTLPESQASLIPDSSPVSSVVLEQQDSPAAAPEQSAQTPAEPHQTPSDAPTGQKSFQWENVAGMIWVAGMALMAAYGLVSYLLLRRKVAASVAQDGAWLCDEVVSPFILGIFRPRIYLPSALEADCRESVLAHERAHLRRKDHWWKPMGFVLLAIHWFNPLMWLAYILLCRDIEAACDERVVKGMNTAERKRYSEALLSCSLPRRSIAACPLAFGEQGIKGRIKSVLSYKKPTIWIIIVAVVALFVLAICFLTNPNQSTAYLDVYIDPIRTTGEVPKGEYTRYTLSGQEDNLKELLDIISAKEDWKDLSQYKMAPSVSYSITIVSSNKEETYYFDAYETWVFKKSDGRLWFAELITEEQAAFSGFKETVVKEPSETEPYSDLHYVMSMKIEYTLPSCPAFETDCFYAADEDARLYRVYWSDMEGLSEGQSIRVTYSSDSKKKLEYPDGYPDGGYTPKYEITAVAVEGAPLEPSVLDDAALRAIADTAVMKKFALTNLDHYEISLSRHETYGTASVNYRLYLFGYRTSDFYNVFLNEDGSIIDISGDYSEYARYLPYATEEAFAAAKSKMDARAAGGSDYYLDIDSEGYLCLCREVIHYIDPPAAEDGTVMSGCGVDHQHLFLCERICHYT